MRPLRHGIALAVALTIALLAGADEKKQSGSKTKPTSEQDYKQLGQIHEIVGKIVRASPSDKSLTLQIEYPVLQPWSKAALESADLGALALYRDQQRLFREEQKSLTARNPAQAAKQVQQLHWHALRVGASGNNGNGSAFKVVTQRKEFDLQATDDVNVRLAKLPLEFDDKGYPKKYTDKELKERKGPDPNLPGYASSFEELKPGHIVKVTFGRAKTDSKDADKKDEHPHITRIIVVDEGTPPPQPKGAKKKK